MATAEPAPLPWGSRSPARAAGSARLDCAGSESHFLPRPEPAVAVKAAPRGRKRLCAVYFGCGLADGAGPCRPGVCRVALGSRPTSGEAPRRNAPGPVGEGVRGMGGGRQVVEGQRMAEVGVPWGTARGGGGGGQPRGRGGGRALSRGGGAPRRRGAGRRRRRTAQGGAAAAAEMQRTEWSQRLASWGQGEGGRGPRCARPWGAPVR